MVFKFVLFVFLFISSSSHAEIIYDKYDITITEIELNIYKKLHLENNGFSLEDNQAIKKIVLLIKTIDFLTINNNEFMTILDERIKFEFGENIFKEKILLNFIRFQKIRSEFITEYFQNNFNLKDLEKAFVSTPELKLPLSKNDCLTIDKIYEAKNDKQFLLGFFELLKGGQNKIKTQINDISYDICINEKLFNYLESLIIRYIEIETEEDFNNFIYGKIS
jgi:hypothetical protein